MKHVGCISLGCPKNCLDSEVMLGLLHEAGYAIVPEDEAEILIVNTCGFIQEAKEEAIETTLEATQYKTEGACRILIMAGCFAQRYVAELIEELPEVDYFMGLDDVPNIVAICDQLTRQLPASPNHIAPQLSRATPSVYLYDHTLPRLRFGHAHTAYVKIAEGCRYQCAFCAIPLIRGKLRSRPIDSIVREVEMLGEQGVKEIILIAQDTTSYGWDRTGKSEILPLLEALLRIDSIAWIRLMYAYPTTLTPEVMRLIATEPKLCTYLDLPLQHIDHDILTTMRRGISEARTRDLIKRIRDDMPNVTLRSSFIVGFPGETEAAFEKLDTFLRDVRFDRVGVFTYSHEDGTPAYTLEPQISREVAEARRAHLMKTQAQISLETNQALVGSIQTVLVDGESAETPLLLEGRTEGQAPDIDGVVYINEGHTTPGNFEKALITEAFPHDIIGKIVQDA